MIGDGEVLLGKDAKGRLMIRTANGMLAVESDNGTRVTLSRKHITRTIDEYKAEIAKYEQFLAALDKEQEAA